MKRTQYNKLKVLLKSFIHDNNKVEISNSLTLISSTERVTEGLQFLVLVLNLGPDWVQNSTIVFSSGNFLLNSTQ